MISYSQLRESFIQYDHITPTYGVLLKLVDRYFSKSVKDMSFGVDKSEIDYMSKSAGKLANQYALDLENPDRRLVRFQDLPVWKQYKKHTEKFIRQYNILKDASKKLQYDPNINPRSYESKKLRDSTKIYYRIKSNLQDTYETIRSLDEVIRKQRQQFMKDVIKGDIEVKATNDYSREHERLDKTLSILDRN